MTGTNNDNVQEQAVTNNEPVGQIDDESAPKTIPAEKKEEHSMPSSAQEQEAIMKKKYGGVLPKKKPLISKDHERAFFDSADWALGKGAQKPKGPLEALRPKLQPNPHQQARSRRSAYAPGGEDGPDPVSPSEDTAAAGDDDNNMDVVPADESCHN